MYRYNTIKASVDGALSKIIEKETVETLLTLQHTFFMGLKQRNKYSHLMHLKAPFTQLQHNVTQHNRNSPPTQYDTTQWKIRGQTRSTAYPLILRRSSLLSSSQHGISFADTLRITSN